MKFTAYLAALCFALVGLTSAAENNEAEDIPSATAALEAFDAFSANPYHNLDKTQTFLDFIRASGQVHIVLNETLLAWMYDDMPQHNKAVLYAAFLGGNMAGQLADDDASSNSDNVGGMISALKAYAAIRAEDSEFSLPLFEQLAAAQSNGQLVAEIDKLTATSDEE